MMSEILYTELHDIPMIPLKLACVGGELEFVIKRFPIKGNSTSRMRGHRTVLHQFFFAPGAATATISTQHRKNGWDDAS